MKKIIIDVTRNYYAVKEDILNQLPYPGEIREVRRKLLEVLSTDEFLDAEELLNIGLLKLDGSRYDMGYNVAKALENGIDKIVIEI